MVFIRNVPVVERVVRVGLGVALLAAALWWFGANAKGWVVGASGLLAVLTGMLGWCPMCAVARRRI